ncbi:MAG: hypothetical protein OXE85_13360 [Roseovarius sp.]|nr:hypothetical protein [Roseovarius sp.]MCY4316732.1 hypothetical protein [Roseovarius sp.]
MGRENGPVSGRSIMRQCPCTASPPRAAEGNVFDGAMDCIPADLTSRLARAFPNGAAPNSFCARTFTAGPPLGASAHVGRGGGAWPGSETPGSSRQSRHSGRSQTLVRSFFALHPRPELPPAHVQPVAVMGKPSGEDMLAKMAWPSGEDSIRRTGKNAFMTVRPEPVKQ